MAEAKQQGSGLGTAALILGIVALVTAFIPFINFVTGLIALVGLILGIIGIVKSTNKGPAIAGTVLSAVSGFLAIIMITVYTAAFFGAVGSAIDQANEEMNTPVSVTYQVTGEGKDVTVTYSTYTNDVTGTEQVTPATLPFSKTVEGTKGWGTYSVTATNGAEDTTAVSCSITIDDEVVVTQTSTGAFATVSCAK